MTVAPHFKASVEAKEFLSAMRRVSAMDTNSVIPILNHAWLRIVDGRLLITGTDTFRGLTVSVECEGSGEVTASISALTHFATWARGGQVSFELSGSTLICRNAEMVHKLPTLSVKDYPVVMAEEITAGAKWNADSSDLKNALSSCSEAMERGKIIRAYIHGAHFQFGPQPFIYSTDGLCLCRVAMPDFIGKEAANFTLPAEAIPALLALCDDGDKIEICFSGGEAGRVSFSVGGAMLRSTLIVEAPPQFERIIPKDGAISFKVNADVALATFARSTPTDVKARILEVSISQDEDSLTCLGRGGDGYLSEDSCPVFDVVGSAKGLRFGMVPGFLKWAISTLDSETVTFTTNGPFDAFVLTGKRALDDLRIIMPKRI